LTNKEICDIINITNEREVKIMYRRVIVDECGEIMEYVSDLTGAEINEILEEHPEWRITCQAI
jgi:hypothetical protein